MPAELPKYRLQPRPVQTILEPHGRGQIAASAHTGGEHTLQVINASYANPEILRLPLECGVNVIAAHAATDSGLTDPNYFQDSLK